MGRGRGSWDGGGVGGGDNLQFLQGPGPQVPSGHLGIPQTQLPDMTECNSFREKQERWFVLAPFAVSEQMLFFTALPAQRLLWD